MSDFFTRTLFAGASVAMTLAMVAASASASASAAVPADVRQQTVQIGDLNLANPAGQKTLERRLNAAVDLVCPDADAAFDRQCRTAAIARARTEIDRKANGGTAS